MQMNRPKQVSDRRSGFTLIELMMVIVIIAIMAAFLVPAVGRSIRSARIAGVVAEISQLESAISKFKADHGIEPPSSIVLYETGTATATAGTGWANDVLSTSIIRQLWPQYDFAGNYDINGNGTTTDVIYLSTGECLVFFLGGVNGNTTSGSTTANNNVANHIGACTGFSKIPTMPFARGGNREAPLFEFQPARFKDLDSDGFPEYADSLPSQKNPYMYYSGYDGQAYAVVSGGAGTIYRVQEFGNSAASSTFGIPVNELTQCYYQDAAMTQPWKPNSHQIISPGFDGQYGFGGPYIAKGNPTLPAGGSGTPTIAQRKQELDNITNFASGELSPY